MSSVRSVRCGGNYVVHCRASNLRQLMPRRQCFFPCKAKISMSLHPHPTLDSFPSSSPSPSPKHSSNSQEDRIDQWMKQSVTEIVKKLPESPLLVQVYSDECLSATMMENAEENKWVFIKERWQKGEMPMPDGVIFVEKIEEEEEEGISKAWGIVVQGRGEAEGQAWCTHFCLVRVRSLRETAVSQLKNCWLLQGH